MLSSTDLLDQKEKSQVHQFFWSSIGTLKSVDQKLPQIKSMAGCLKRGFGIHHSGILPILKEIVEMLFQRGLIKVLFATETFAMGVNMPARSVVFDSTRKHDGHDFRDLNPSEYIQMAGRAGRRGLDETGTVVILCKGEVPDSLSLRSMMLGKPPVMESRFRVTYNMVLNLLRVRQLKIEDILRRCFREVFAERSRDERKDKLQEFMTELTSMNSFQCNHCSPDNNLETYWNCVQKHESSTLLLLSKICSSKSCSKILCFGRIVFVNYADKRNIPGALLSLGKQSAMVLLLTRATKVLNSETLKSTPWKPSPNIAPMHKKDVHCVQEIHIDQITCVTCQSVSISKKKAQRMRNDVSDQAEAVLPDLLQSVTERASALKWHSFEDIDLHDIWQGIQSLEHQMTRLACTQCPQFDEHYATRCKQFQMQTAVKKMELELSTTSLFPNYQACLRVLEMLKYVNSQHLLTMRGKVACELSSFELLLTELLSKGLFTECSPAECAALLSCFVFQQKGDAVKELSPSLKRGILEIVDVARSLEDVQRDCGLHDDPDYRLVENLKFGLTHVVYQWAKGTPFADIAELTDVDEGIIVRTIQRLVEIMKDIRNASHIFGNDALKQKMEEASQAIKRDIVFAASLYVK